MTAGSTACAHPDESMMAMVADMDVVNRFMGDHLTLACGEKYVRGVAGRVENDVVSIGERIGAKRVDHSRLTFLEPARCMS